MTRSEQTLAIISAIGELASKLTGEPLVFDVPTKNGVYTIIAGEERRWVADEGPLADPGSTPAMRSAKHS